jgi:MYXO-CTERM domain-containing protein
MLFEQPNPGGHSPPWERLGRRPGVGEPDFDARPARRLTTPNTRSLLSIMRPLHLLVAATLALTFAAASRADVAPPTGFVETCTLEKQASPGQECHDCRAYYGNHDHCSNSLSSFGFSQKCRSRGASSWSEVWCRAASPSAAKLPGPILAQLNDASGKPGPLPSGLAPTPAPSASEAATPAASAAPSALPTAPPAPPPTSAPTPSPAPAPKKRSCAFSGHERGGSSTLLAAAGVALAVLRRRRR